MFSLENFADTLSLNYTIFTCDTKTRIMTKKFRKLIRHQSTSRMNDDSCEKTYLF